MTLDISTDYLIFDNLLTSITLRRLSGSTVTINNVQIMPATNENGTLGIESTGIQAVMTVFCIFTTEYSGPIETNARITAAGKHYRIVSVEQFALKSARNATCIIEAGEGI